MLKRLARWAVMALAGLMSRARAALSAQPKPQGESVAGTSPPGADPRETLRLEHLIWRTWGKLPYKSQASLLSRLIETTQSGQPEVGRNNTILRDAPRIHLSHSPMGAAVPFNAGILRVEMVDLVESVRRSKRPLPVYYLVLPKGSAQQTSTWRIVLHFGGIPPRMIGLELRGEVRLGRSLETDLDLRPYGAEYKGVSRHHALLSPQPSHLALTDVGSSNGTFVNSAHLVPGRPFDLDHGDVVSLGKLMFVVSIVERPAVH